MESSSQDRNLPASERKLRRAIEDGQVTRSRDLSHLAVLGAGSLALFALAPRLLDRLKLDLLHQLSFDARTLDHPGTMLTRMQEMVVPGLIACALFAVIVAIAVVLSTLAVGGWVNSVKPLLPDFSRLDPFAGLGRMFTKDKFAEMAKMLVVLAAVGVIGGLYLARTGPELVPMAMQPSMAAVSHLTRWLVTGMALLLLVIAAVAAIDMPLQRFLHRARLRMTHQEVKQEHKESEGNPHVKGKLRQRQREISQRNSIAAVPKADFVVMNPTHYAVALRYDEATMPAPQVVSRGTDLLALKIRDIARGHDIPVLQAPRLARALYAHAELDQDIPVSLYSAVAQVLAYVYRLRAAERGEAPMPEAPPTPEVPAGLDPHERPARHEPPAQSTAAVTR